jgi:glucosamine-6-phosphate deaminase
MEIIIQPDSQTASAVAARLVAHRVREKDDCVLGLATGSTPLALYRELIRMHRDEGLDFSHVTTFNLDEYVGLSPGHPASYRRYMQENFFDPVNVPEQHIHIPDGLAPDIPALCRQYEGAIRAAGGIDVQILGIGADGHIGFNEPTSSLASRTRIKTLSEKTRRDNAVHFDSPDEVPHHVITLGVGTIMESRLCILLAFGEQKADAVAKMVEGPVTAMVPASALQAHPNVKVFLDESATSRLDKADYYRWVYDHKPDWQRW